MINTLRPSQDGCHFPDDVFKCIFLNENAWILIDVSLNFVPKVRIHNIPALVQIMAWHLPGDKPLSEPMMVSLLMHICITWSQWNEEVLVLLHGDFKYLFHFSVEKWHKLWIYYWVSTIFWRAKTLPSTSVTHQLDTFVMMWIHRYLLLYLESI